MENRIVSEINSFTCPFEQRIATVGTTARDSLPFAVLPRRTALGYEAINFLVVSPDAARELFSLVDPHVAYLFIDIESKKEIDLLQIAKTIVKKARIIAYKPNDTTLEAADLFLRHSFKDELENKKMLIYGAGNLGSKLALRLAERGCSIYLSSRNDEKTKEIVKVLNYLLPKFAKNKIHYLKTGTYEPLELDCLISFTSSSHVIPPEMAVMMKTKSVALDGGINNFTPQFILEASGKEITCYRLDVRAAFPHTLLYLIQYIRDFYTNIQGEVKWDNGIRVVAGGIIGNDGDIVVDRIQQPTQIVGIANGVGGLKDEQDYTAKDQSQLTVFRKSLQQEKR
ncbi:hypothetical protein P6709_08130 [Jeotgalibacillus sp. ET6]|uniref:hypothetical protein n=1 Tax=Jeotgalibacillus sp. ET6 TaxID=3037260 RepID=UPI0024188D18|nr:hypothetical protein [Jeotgalibacillus sp. ET6]MDG5471714.1 hypothetical protein [Jeotgalibacillus sp. ET6]